MTSSREAWERVLAAVEADARHAEALLHAPLDSFGPEAGDAAPAPSEDAAPPTGLPADWLLPTSVDLPPLESMPPVPAELSDRILELRSQIMSLQSELAAALRDMPRNQPRAMVAATTVEVPAYIDRRL